MKSLIFFILSFSMCPYFIHTVWANTEFTIHIQETLESRSHNQGHEKGHLSDMTVDLGATYFSYTKGDIQHFYDFAQKRIIRLDRKKKIFADDSLFSDIGLRTYEFQAHLKQDKPAAADNVGNTAFSPVLYEHLFSLEREDLESELQEISDEETITYSFENATLLSRSQKGENVSKDDMDMFVKFFRYIFGGHPNILEKISQDHTIPAMIRIYHYDNPKGVKTLTLSSFKTTQAHSFSLKGCSSGVLAKDDDGFLHFLHKVSHSERIELMQHMDSLLQEADQYFQDGLFLDTMLSYIEYRFVSGLPSYPLEFVNKKSLLEADDNVLFLFKAVQTPKNGEMAQQYFDMLTMLEKEATYKKHILSLFKANTYLKIGHHQDAKKLFHKVLRANPNITLAYKDLGGIYFKESNTKTAWRCWDVARKIAPGNRMLMYLDSYEKTFELNYPEFF